MTIKEQLDNTRVPAHIAIIMDGNGRWAKAQGLPRTAGHVQGVESVKNVTEAAARIGVKWLTVYAFSTENWNRPTQEIDAIMGLVITELEEEIFMKNDVRFRVIGEMERLPENVQERLRHCMERTAANQKMTLVVSLSYSARWEITRAARQLAEEVRQGTLQPQDISEELLTRHMATAFMPDPDLMIRTGGEQRISNYLLWQSAYTEFYFCDTYWPDFGEEQLYQAILDYQHRQRRFGKTGEQVEASV